MEAKPDYRCTDCGRKITYQGTCPDCLVKNRPPPKRLIQDLRNRKRK